LVLCVGVWGPAPGAATGGGDWAGMVEVSRGVRATAVGVLDVWMPTLSSLPLRIKASATAAAAASSRPPMNTGTPPPRRGGVATGGRGRNVAAGLAGAFGGFVSPGGITAQSLAPLSDCGLASDVILSVAAGEFFVDGLRAGAFTAEEFFAGAFRLFAPAVGFRFVVDFARPLVAAGFPRELRLRCSAISTQY
jgi:hypothetical protein